jgi:lipid-A-disaccharide synthase
MSEIEGIGGGEGSSLLIVAGEVSGDIHGANLLTELNDLGLGAGAFGVGGERLARAGLECVARTEELSHMGLVEVVRELPRIRAIMRRLEELAQERGPRLAVLIDSPDFNLRLAARLKRLGVPVVLYVSPQLWAWRRGRVRTVRRLADEVLCILPFEVPFYAEHEVAASYVGHPLVDDLSREGLLGEAGLARRIAVDRGSRRLALLPGSRAMEVRQLLPAMIRALRLLPDSVVEEAVLIEAPGVASIAEKVLEESGTDPRLRRVGGEERRRVLAASAGAWTASGTATLECALLDVPMVVGYRLQSLSYVLARLLVKVPHVALVNLIAGRRLAPELIQGQWQEQRLAALTPDLLGAGGANQRAGLREVRSRLGGPGASRRAAESVARYLDEGQGPEEGSEKATMPRNAGRGNHG